MAIIRRFINFAPRRLQFSVRTLLLIVAIVSLPFGWLGMKIRDGNNQRAIVKQMWLSGRVEYDYEFTPHKSWLSSAAESVEATVSLPRVSNTTTGLPHPSYAGPPAWSPPGKVPLPQPPAPQWLRNLLGIDVFSNVVYVSRTAGELTDPRVEQLCRLKHLKHLCLHVTHLTDSDLSYLLNLSSLEWLDLKSNDITDVGIGYLSQLTSLRELYLEAPLVGDEGLRRLAEVPVLRELHFTCGRVTDDGLYHLQGITQLEFLDLGHTAITDDGLRHLRAMPKLRALDLKGTKITDEGLVHLQGLSQLKVVSLLQDRMRVRGNGIKSLRKAMPGLRVL